MKKRLLLLGGGHSHVHVLKSLAEARWPEVDVTLLSPWPRQVYSGMLPGWVAGHYRLEQCLIPLAPMAARAGAHFVEDAAVALDLNNKIVDCAGGQQLGFDLLSIDSGSVADLGAIPGAAEHALSVRPIEVFIEAIARLKDAVVTEEKGAPLRIAFVGAGAGGIELALALHHALAASGVEITLVSAANTLPGNTGKRIERLLQRHNIRLIAGQAATRIDAGRVHLASGEPLAAGLVISATGAAAAQWPRAAGLACDARGFILVNDCLQSVSHPQVFAAGDCASMENFVRPKSGVYAVRAGPPLAKNLRLALAGAALAAYRPQAHSLYLLSTGGRHAIASWGPFTWEGDWVWRWKDRIDRAFIANYTSGGSEP